MSDGRESAQSSAFVDVISNTLMVVLVMTLILVALGGLRLAGAPRPAEAVSRLPVRQPDREVFPPWSRYYVVRDGRLVELDLTAITALLERDGLRREGTAWWGQVPQGRFLWQDRRADFAARRELGLPVGDVDAYRLELIPDAAWFAAAPGLYAPGGEGALVARWSQALRERREVPGFFVYASGMDLFASLYPALRAAGLRLRWTALKEDERVVLYRSDDQFTSPMLRY